MVASRFLLRRATPSDAEAVGANMRPEDAAECLASEGVSPVEAVRESIEASTEAWTLEIDGEVACSWGVVPMDGLPGVGVVWLLTTSVVDRHALTFWRLSRLVVAELLGRWVLLVNAIDARHTKAIRWAKRLGFALEEAKPYGIAGLPFHRFAARAAAHGGL